LAFFSNYFIGHNLLAQNASLTDNHSCRNAIVVCESIYAYSPSNESTSFKNRELNKSTGYSVDDAWYSIQVKKAGKIVFSIIPNNLEDDYDWTLYNASSYSCEEIHNIESLEVGSNYSSVAGITGANTPGAVHSQGREGQPSSGPLRAVAGENYLLKISNLSRVKSGYTLDFSESTADIYDSEAPAIESAMAEDGGHVVRLVFSEPVKCNSIHVTDFVVKSSMEPYKVHSIEQKDCHGGGGQEFALNVSPAIFGQAGMQIHIADELQDMCGNYAMAKTYPIEVLENAALKADFEVANTCFGRASKFYSLCQNAVAWHWVLGDGTTSDAEHPVHIYEKPGQYNVTLTATGIDGTVDRLSMSTEVYGAPAANFIGESACLGTEIQFYELSTSGNGLLTSFAWDFGDGSQIENRLAPTHMYGEEGLYEVTLLVKDKHGCAARYAQEVEVYAPATVDFSYSSTYQGNAMPFKSLASTSTKSSVVKWDWDFGDGGTSTAKNPFHAFKTHGHYDVTLLATTADGCQGTITKNVKVYEQAMASFGSIDEPRSGDDLTASADNNGVRETEVSSWRMRVANPSQQESKKPATYHRVANYSQGTTQPSTSSSAFNFDDMDCMSANVHVNIVVTQLNNKSGVRLFKFEVDSSTEIEEYVWDFGDGMMANEEAPTHVYKEPGVYEVNLVVLTKTGCTLYFTTKVTIKQ